ncbi:MAG: DUF3604 domain-containing protein [Armatimonadota bacterium]
MRYQTFWGDTHHNCYTSARQDPPITDVLAFTRTHLDFYTGAYYTPVIESVPLREHAAIRHEAGGHAMERSMHAAGWQGIKVEGMKPADRLAREWEEFQRALAEHHAPGEFVTFPGYEWHGDGSWGDHNVVYRHEGQPIHIVNSLPDLYTLLREQEALAIPHHTGYLPGIRAPRWAYCDESLSPFAELYSIHGCSETDEEWIGLRRNSHMGPGAGGGTYQDALDAGLHLGAICSTDNWTNMPGRWGHGLMACLAEELTRESLWDAFRRRRVYGVTGDRIALDFTCNGAPMGSMLPFTPERHLEVTVRGLDALDRVEILRNGRVIATHCHQGTWELPEGKTSFLLRIEAGWGPRPGEIPFAPQRWEGELSLSGGRFTGWSPCWITRGQGVPELRGDTARFTLTSEQSLVEQGFQGGIALECEASLDTPINLRLNGQQFTGKVRDLAAGSRLLWYREDSASLVQESTGADPAGFERDDPLYHHAFKAKLHRAIPEAAFTARFELTDDEPLSGETHYRVRVEQRNAQRAWSSPIWIQPTSG